MYFIGISEVWEQELRLKCDKRQQTPDRTDSSLFLVIPSDTYFKIKLGLIKVTLSFQGWEMVKPVPIFVSFSSLDIFIWFLYKLPAI